MSGAVYLAAIQEAFQSWNIGHGKRYRCTDLYPGAAARSIAGIWHHVAGCEALNQPLCYISPRLDALISDFNFNQFMAGDTLKVHLKIGSV